MKKFIISLAALAAFSTAAAAASYGNRDDDSIFDSSAANPALDEAGFVMPNANADAVAIAEIGDGWLLGSGENVKDPMEVRRFDEKN